MKRKLLSILLTLCLAFSLLPTAALADGETAVAKVGDDEYPTLAEAVAAVADGGTVTLLKNSVGSGIGTYKTPERDVDGKEQIGAKGFTIDFNSFTYSVDRPAVGSKKYETQGFHLEWKGSVETTPNITLKNGTLNVAEQHDPNLKLLIQNYCNLTLDNMTVDGTNLTKGWGNYTYVTSNCNGTVKIKDTTIISKDPTLDVAFDVDGDHADRPYGAVSLTIEGNSNISGKFEFNTNRGGNKLSITGGTFTSDVSAYVPNGYIYNSETKTVEPLDETNAVAKVGDTYYATLAAAVAAAQNNDTVTLLKDVAYATKGEGLLNITKSIILDGNGHSISGYGARGSNKTTTLAINHNGSESVNVTLKNLTINNDGGNGRAVETRGNIDELTVDNCKFNCTGSGNTQVLTIGGNQSDSPNIFIINKSELNAGNSGYPIITFNPINLQMTGNSKLSGYCGIYFKGVDSSEGSHKSVVTAKNCSFDCPNVHGGGSNDFGVFALEDDNIAITLENCSINAEVQGQADQAVLMASRFAARQGGYSISICGDSLVNGKLLSSSWSSSESNKYMITGGYFTSDPSAYLAEGKGLVTSDQNAFAYKVGDKATNVETAVTAGEAAVTIPEGVTGITEAAVKNAAKAADTTKTLTDTVAASGMTNDPAVVGTKEAAEAALSAKNISVGSGDTVTVVVQPYLEVNVKSADAGKLTLEISAKYNVVATTGSPVTIDPAKTATLKSGVPLSINKPIELTIVLPTGFAAVNSKIYVQHKGYEYTATVDASGATATFINPHGFSTFTVTPTASAVAEVDGTNYTDLQKAVDAVSNNGTVKLLNDTSASAVVSRAVKFTLDKNSKSFTGAITAGSGYELSVDGNVYTFTVRSSSGSSGSSSYDPTYSVSTPSKTEHGTVTVSPKSASKGDTVTVTVKPDSGYVLETLTVTDKNGNELTLKDKGNGKYTFTMPAGKVEVKATFMEDNSMLNFFYDVPNGAYFYEAVKWAVENGITDGVGNDLFAPEQPCTRAQIVTFLWRAAGSPEPKGAASGMTDVVSGSYYEKAVAWAIENGITTGTTTSTFSPDATCTRAQAVTFLARALKAKAASAAEFSDVPTGSYFADAVAWAAANGVTEGIGGGLFGSDNDCTRGQIVTFLYRAYNK